MNDKIKILVIGCNGQLGHCIKDISEYYLDFKFIFDITYVDYDVLDITNYKAIDEYLSNHKFDYVVNCAAYTNVPKAEHDVDNAYLVNANGPRMIAEVCKRLNVKFIHISTDYVYDKNGLIDEYDKTCPLNAYGRTKLAGDVSVMMKNPDAIILRTAWLYSCYGKNFVKTIIHNLMKDEKDLQVVYDQIGSPTCANSLAEAILTIIKNTNNKENEWVGGVYNYTDEGFCSWYDFANMIDEYYYYETKELAGWLELGWPEQDAINVHNFNHAIIPISSAEFDKLFSNDVKRPSISMLNKSKIKKQFGVKTYHWALSLSQMIHDFVKYRKKYEPELYLN